MMTPIAEFKRKDIRLPRDRYRAWGLYFLMLCFQNRRRFGARPRVASWLVAKLRKHAATCAFFIHAYCVMPDHIHHIHLLAAGSSEESNLIKFVESFKQDTAIEFARRTRHRLWQFKYYDRILRNSDAADRVAWYIWLNPIRKALCCTPNDYPFLGSFTDMGTKLLRNALVTPWVPPWKSDKANSCRAEDRGATLEPEEVL